jgi:uncharacterized membrane protein
MEESKNVNNESEQVSEKPEKVAENVSGSEKVKEVNGDVQENKSIALLSYISILFLIPLLSKKDSTFCQFHAKQGLVLFIVEVIGWFLTPFFGLGVLVNLVALILLIVGIVNVLNGEMKKLPLIGDFADKFNL